MIGNDRADPLGCRSNRERRIPRALTRQHDRHHGARATTNQRCELGGKLARTDHRRDRAVGGLGTLEVLGRNPRVNPRKLELRPPEHRSDVTPRRAIQIPSTQHARIERDGPRTERREPGDLLAHADLPRGARHRNRHRQRLEHAGSLTIPTAPDGGPPDQPFYDPDMASTPRSNPSHACLPLGRRLCELAHAASLAAWFAAVVGAGLTAALVFPEMKSLDPTLGAYPSYGGEHWRLGAGRIAARGFLIADAVQLAAAIVAVATLVGSLLLRLPARRVSTLLRALFTGGAATLLAVRFFYLAPRMNAPLRGYWEAAALGETERAEKLAADFGAYHGAASNIYTALALLTLAALLTAVWSIAMGDATRSRRAALPEPTLETPALASGKGGR